ncbi:uncharacterized protein K444DRAFT_621209 [Hyaloscypha bicolor E]|uniref:Uncharacterized protein n=1 Tax=Hyaloscypha bicolor E TaxID=1095630 RepID=A0A2J6SMT3_9HELO|nr:uncharacterized protein K444DRAFT_621209 [Hyaloscypha bicolor E]PMD52077.1 hypothetical protein K444DRAFT_621209 [Hyaloscypha bicolor E]
MVAICQSGFKETSRLDHSAPSSAPPPQEHSRSPTYTSTCLYASGEDLDLQRLKDDSASFPLTSQSALTPIPPPPK